MKIVEFRHVTTNDMFDNTYPHWSRKYEYPLLMDEIYNKLLKNIDSPKIHNTSWGFDTEHHGRFKNELESLYGDGVLNTDILKSNLPRTDIYDITCSPPEEYVEMFDCVLNVSALEEITGDHILYFNNLFSQVKLGGYVILTFDLPGLQLKRFETLLGQSMQVSESKIYRTSPNYLEVGLLIIQKEV